MESDYVSEDLDRDELIAAAAREREIATERVKAIIRRQLEDIGVRLPDWVFLGATTAQLRPLPGLFREAWERVSRMP